jgi:hypothetical protein
LHSRSLESSKKFTNRCLELILSRFLTGQATI